MQPHQISVQELKLLTDRKENFFLLDVRNPDEHQLFNLGGTLIPLSELAQRVNEIPRDVPVIIYCHSGYRSGVAQELLQSIGIKDVKNLMGGVVAWQQLVKN